MLSERFEGKYSRSRTFPASHFWIWLMVFGFWLGRFPLSANESTNTVPELSLLTLTNSTTGLEGTLTYNLVQFPPGASVDTNGVITWTPSEEEGPSTNIITVVVSNGTQSLTNDFLVMVTEVNAAPLATNDTYSVTNNSLTVAAPGVLANDFDSDIPANPLTAVLVSGPTNGVLNLNSNGGFVYTPDPGFSGSDGFTYHVNDGQSDSEPAYVALAITLPDFRITAIDTLADRDVVTWNSTVGKQYRLLYKDSIDAANWNVVPRDVVASGPSVNKSNLLVNASQRFYRVQILTNRAPEFLPAAPLTVAELSALSVTNTATDADLPNEILAYSLISAPTGAVLNANGVIDWTPSESQGPSTNTFEVVVTDNGGLTATNTFTVVVTEVNEAPTLPAPSDVTLPELTLLTVTNTATDIDEPANLLSYTLINPPIGAQVDTNGIITWIPSEAQGPSTNILTTVVTDEGGLSATNSFTVVVTEVNATPLLPTQPNLTVPELVLLTVTNTATDTDAPADHLTYQLAQHPVGAVIETNGVITWTPSEAQGPGTNVFTTVVTDDGGLSATNSFTVTVTEVNAAPQLPLQTNLTLPELVLLTVTNTATDPDIPADILTYQLIQHPSGAVIDTNGVITWTPNEAQGPSTNVFTTIVTDGGGLSATNSFTVAVTEVNNAPQLPAQTNLTVPELALLTVTNAATDPDIPADTLTYQLIQHPSGAVIDTNGVITWTPNEAQGPSTNVFTIIVTDGVGLSATNSFTVVVTEVNAPPQLPAQTNLTVPELALLTVTNAATDQDIPADTLTYQLVQHPSGAAIDTNGVITWIPTEAQGPSTNIITTVVTDSGGLSATNTFTIVVTEVNVAPALAAQSNRTIPEQTLLTVTNSALDADQPANTLTYSLTQAPSGAIIDTNGVITWTPTEAQSASTNVFTTVVSDGGLSATNSFTVTVTEVNTAPVANNNSYTVTNLVLTITAPGVLANDTDSDIPTNALTALLASGVTNGTLTLSNNGGFVYTPNPGFAGNDAFTYTANDGPTNSAPATVTLTVGIRPLITQQPAGQSASVGSNVTFSVTASGSLPMAYQWRKDGSNLPSATASTLLLTNVQVTNSGNYLVVVTNSFGAVTSTVASLAVSVPINCIAAPANMVGWWPGDSNANDIFSSNHGTLQGGATASGVGKVAQGFTFDGTNNYVSIPDSPSLRPTNFTIEAWVKFDNLNSAGNAAAGQQYIVFKQNTLPSSFEGYYLGKERNGNNDTFAFGVTPAEGPGANVNSTTLISTGVWYHVAAVRNPTTIQLYVNGQMQDEAVADFDQDYGNFPLYFGTSGQASWDRKFKGVLDEVTIYNRPLSAGEIAAIYAADSNGKCKQAAAPAILVQPTNRVYVAGGTTTFAVVAAGSEPLGYHWFRDGFLVVNDARISGATGPSLTLTQMQPGDIGNYQVVVSNNLGTATSAIASLNTGAPPANDNFGSAVSIGGTSGSITGNNANATRQNNEPDHAGNPGPCSVWYNWTAPSASPVTIDTTMSAFDTLLGVYTGNSLSSLTLVATNNNISTNNSRSRVTFTPVAGTIYRIAVDGANGANGNLTLRWIQASVALPDLVIFGSAVNPFITTETFAPGSCAVMEGLVPAGTRRLIRFDTQTANQGNADLVFGNPANNPLFVYANCHAHYHFQNYMSYRLRNSSGEIAAVGLKVGFCVLDVFRWDTGAPNNAKYDCNNQGIQKGWGDLYDSTLDGQWIDITGLPDGNYTMEMEANPMGIIQESNYGNNITLVPITIGNSTNPPPNDNFVNAQMLLGTSPSVVGTTTNATKQAGEPDHAGDAGGHSVWYDWTAPSTKAVSIDTIGSSIDTLLGVYTGNAVGSLTLVTNNDDIVPDSVLQSRVTFDAVAGTTYRIAVDGFNGVSGKIVVTVNQTVANDAFSACIFSGGVQGTLYGSTDGATKETNEPNHAGNTGGHSIWYCWTAPIGGQASFDTFGSTFNTTLAIYTGNSVGALTLVAANDDFGGGTNQSRATFNAVGLTMYHIAIDGFDGESGNTRLNWSFATASPNSLVGGFASSPDGSIMPSDGRATLSFNLLAEGMCQIAISGQPQQRYRIERSCNLQIWQPLATTVADFEGKAWFTDKAAKHLVGSDSICGGGILGVSVSPTEARFYRAVAVP